MGDSTYSFKSRYSVGLGANMYYVVASPTLSGSPKHINNDNQALRMFYRHAISRISSVISKVWEFIHGCFVITGLRIVSKGRDCYLPMSEVGEVPLEFVY